MFLLHNSVPKDVRINSTHYLIMKIYNKRELQNIAINHSADIDYQDFIKIYRECTKEPYNCLTRDTKLPASDPLRFRKSLFDSYENDNNWSDQNFRHKNSAKWSTIWFRQKAAIISALSSKNQDQVEYLSGEDLALKPNTIEQARFEYCVRFLIKG